MAVKNPRNGLTFTQVREKLGERDRVFVGNNTYAEPVIDPDTGEKFIAVTFHQTKIANLLADGSVQVFHGGHLSKSTAARMDWFLLPLGFRMTFRAHTYKFYKISSGEYIKYYAGCTVSPDGKVS